MDQFDPLQTLQRAGFGTDVGEEQRSVLATLSPAEVGVLTSIKERLDAVDPEVTAHSNTAGNIFH